MERLPLVAIVGRPNVGKSTLFNRLVGERRAAVASMPGLTRDRRYGEVRSEARPFRIVDTGGLDLASDEGLAPQLKAQTHFALAEADLIVLVLDGRQGVTAADREIVEMLRGARRPILAAVNKIDDPVRESLVLEFHELGIDPLVSVSAEHSMVGELLDAIQERLPEDLADEHDGEEPPVRVALVGRPNVGKSSLFNRLLGLERAVVHSEPGTTVDPVDTLLRVGDRSYLMIDTAGIRRHKSSASAAEGIGVTLAFRAIERCQVALVLVDGEVGVSAGDIRVASFAEERGAAVGLLVNKWDLVEGDARDPAAWARKLATRLGTLDHAPVLTLSAKTGKRVDRVLPLVDRLHEDASRTIPTGELNRFLEEAVTRHPPPLDGHRPVRIYYGTQTGTLPPTFQLFSNRPRAVGEAYRRYLRRQLREAYGFAGSPIRLIVRERKRSKSHRRRPTTGKAKKAW